MVRSAISSLFFLTIVANAAVKDSGKINPLVRRSVSLRQESSRKLSLQRIVGYEPRSQVTDQAAIDLDQKTLEEELFLEQMDKARTVYIEGGYSRSYATLTLLAPPGPAQFSVGDQVVGQSLAGAEAAGTLMNSLTIGEDNTANIQVKVQYVTSDIQDKYVGCQVGGLYTFSEANRQGCYNDTGIILVSQRGLPLNESKQFSYTYNPRIDNNNARTLQTFSTTAHNVMRPLSCTDCPWIPDYQTYVNYYGDPNYADKWVLAANGGQLANFSSGRGNADFTKLTFKQANAEAMAKGTIVLNVLMYAIHEMEDSVAYCQQQCANCISESIHALDAAVAFYAGSLEGEDGSGDGRLLYNLADTRAIEFRTSGELADDDQGESYVNIMNVQEFKKMQIYLLQGDCASASQSKQAVVNFMKVPLVQSIFRYAYIRAYENPSAPEDTEQIMAEGATYTAAILPYLHSCNAADASAVYEMMKIGSAATSVDFPAIKAALERNYPCLGITCSQVGGIWTVNGYAANAEACQDGSTITAPETTSETQSTQASTPSNHHSGGLIAGAVIGILAGVALLLFAYMNLQQNKHKHGNRRSSNIAAVAEIS